MHDAPGYEVRFRTGPPGRYTFGSDLMLLPSEEEADGALLLSLRREIRGARGSATREEEFADLATEAMRSVRFGTGPGVSVPARGRRPDPGHRPCTRGAPVRPRPCVSLRP